MAQANQDRFNSEYNGLNPRITNAVLTFGTADSSQSLGVRGNLSDSSVIVIPIEGEIITCCLRSILFIIFNIYRCCKFIRLRWNIVVGRAERD